MIRTCFNAGPTTDTIVRIYKPYPCFFIYAARSCRAGLNTPRSIFIFSALPAGIRAPQGIKILKKPLKPFPVKFQQRTLRSYLSWMFYGRTGNLTPAAATTNRRITKNYSRSMGGITVAGTASKKPAADNHQA